MEVAVSFCALCLDDEADLEFDAELEVMACAPCRFEHPRRGRYAFSSHGRRSRASQADGNRRVSGRVRGR